MADKFNRVFTPNFSRLHHAAQNTSTPAQCLLKSVAYRIHLMARLAFLRNFQQRFADANLNYWDESLGYIATAVLLDYLEG